MQITFLITGFSVQRHLKLSNFNPFYSIQLRFVKLVLHYFLQVRYLNLHFWVSEFALWVSEDFGCTGGAGRHRCGSSAEGMIAAVVMASQLEQLSPRDHRAQEEIARPSGIPHFDDARGSALNLICKLT